MKTATEMFEELGYVKYSCSNSSNYDWQKPCYENEELIRNIHFDLECKTIGIMGNHISKSIGIFGEDWLSIAEFKAIQKQIEELGWL